MTSSGGFLTRAVDVAPLQKERLIPNSSPKSTLAGTELGSAILGSHAAGQLSSPL
jgi:hypothetical protein